MTGTADYTAEELSKLGAAVMTSGMAVSIVDVGIISTAIEAKAMAQEVVGAAAKYPNNGIIQALFSDSAVEQLREQENFRVQVNSEEMQPAFAVNTAIRKIEQALAVLVDKATPQEVQEYKAFIYACADRVANAAGAGLFGTGSPKVSNKEAIALAKLKETLGL
ncbi:MAG TPA: hypothetical protein V6D10_19745 [Trichocoleus sp.]|jgi:hypothetical protein